MVIKGQSGADNGSFNNGKFASFYAFPLSVSHFYFIALTS